jgi:signal transduction histidine kinase
VRAALSYVVDAFVAVLAIGGQAAVWTHGMERRPLVALALLAANGALALRRRFPAESVLAVWLLFLAIVYLSPRGIDEIGAPAFVTMFFAAWAGAAYNDRRRAVLLLLLGYAVTAVVVVHDPEAAFVGDWAWVNGIATIAWFSGLSIHVRANQAALLEERNALLEARREAEKRSAVAEERARIARELHDVVAHSVTVMTVQAGAVRRLLGDDRAREREALETVEATGRQALVEMRRLLGVLRETDGDAARSLGPQPGLAALDALVAQVRRAGLPVELAVAGDHPQLPPGVDVTAYRVVQEALTNALKHGGRGARARVEVRFDPDAVELEVENDGRVAGPGDGLGHGLVGMRERVGIFGGTLEAAARDGGGFLVRARLPLAG